MVEKIHWDAIPTEKVTPQMERKLVYGEKVMVAKMKFKDGFRVPLHYHENEQITSVLSGTIRFWFGADKEQTFDLNAGEVVVIPANVPHEALMIGDVEEIDTWAPIRKDWLDGTDTYLRE
ncbi:cupin domain-containing protein [Aggregatimonas sangjinii]|uniref:Cupin domain-containing protein n=1 Tax=Aggregatimonas sangjinii TaxID=2583587 RepID=A0A5B7SMR9_9FLAO|nr:cupin domain-containing protein [Aggregatimonas sangjinii]QCW99954.1 cupin domain-containing protein [Aggregatimonas sangjinii]